MLSKIMDTAKLIEGGLKALPPYVEDRGVSAWEDSFARRRKAARQVMLDAIEQAGDGKYSGDIGNHSLVIDGVAVVGRSAYEQLMAGWLNAAAKRLAGAA
ncbi:hypothetical protein D4A92_09580 [Rhizobium rosettiformans]|uniref:Uncharacterized protein n=1 Tax=Rhizobium rosettiformans TaxID=1368430 RepID=A0ABX7EUX8_9HYPH|nr:hypothetical protein [Rhizobium rosettiformans]QRF51668.1 hypothetical protein D4A92_09580 [Rhizobium rosettiformans]